MPIIGREHPADIVIPMPQVSAAHAEIRHLSGDTFSLTDLGSSNGTFVNGRRVASAVVRSHDQIRLGSVLFDLHAYAHLLFPPPGAAYAPPLPAQPSSFPYAAPQHAYGTGPAMSASPQGGPADWSPPPPPPPPGSRPADHGGTPIEHVAQATAQPPFSLLRNETIVFDLRTGAIQRLTSDIFLKTTVILTNRRLALLKRRLGSFDKEFVFLRDVTGIESMRRLRLGRAFFGVIFTMAGVGIAAVSLDSPAALMPAAVMLGVGLLLLVYSKWTGLEISTPSKRIFFALGATVRASRVEEFVVAAQEQIGNLKE